MHLLIGNVGLVQTSVELPAEREVLAPAPPLDAGIDMTEIGECRTEKADKGQPTAASEKIDTRYDWKNTLWNEQARTATYINDW